MKRLPVAFLCLALALLSLCCCSRKGKVIPRDEMADIYYDMFMADQWLQDHREFRETADTTLFYEALFRRHGYSTADYFQSVKHYMRDPKRYSRMMQGVIDRLEADRADHRLKILPAQRDTMFRGPIILTGDER